MDKIKNIIFLCFLLHSSFAQKDSLSKTKKLSIIVNTDSTVVFKGKRLIEKVDTSENNKLVISGYVSSYFAYYDDEKVDDNGFVQFATMAPRNKEFGLNVALISMQYSGKNIRSNLCVHYGDIAKAVWPTEFNMIQEANAGVRLFKNLWLDAGFFRSHIGIESTQPRENITSSMSLVNNYEPYYFSGAKLTYLVSEKIAVQLNSFNSFASYVDFNKDKLVGLSVVVDPNQYLSFTYNFISGDETPDNATLKKRRYYNNLYGSLKYNKLYLGLELNYGLQKNSKTNDTTSSATIMSGLIVGKYQLIKKAAFFARQEYFSDPDNILTGNLKTGNSVFGTTGGLEYRPYKNIALSIESRILQSDNLIFKQGKNITNQRIEFIACIDVWF